MSSPFAFDLDAMLHDLRWLAGHTAGGLLPAAEQMARTLGELHAQIQAQDATIRHLRGEAPVGSSAPGAGEARLVAALHTEPAAQDVVEIRDELTRDLDDYRGRLFAIATDVDRRHPRYHQLVGSDTACAACEVLRHIPSRVLAEARGIASTGGTP